MLFGSSCCFSGGLFFSHRGSKRPITCINIFFCFPACRNVHVKLYPVHLCHYPEWLCNFIFLTQSERSSAISCLPFLYPFFFAPTIVMKIFLYIKICFSDVKQKKKGILCTPYLVILLYLLFYEKIGFQYYLILLRREKVTPVFYTPSVMIVIITFLYSFATINRHKGILNSRC